MRFAGQDHDREVEVRRAASPQAAGQPTASWSKGAGRSSSAREAASSAIDRPTNPMN